MAAVQDKPAPLPVLASPERFTRVMIETRAGEIEARLSEYGNWELRVRRHEDDTWRLACSGDLDCGAVTKTPVIQKVEETLTRGPLVIDPISRRVEVNGVEVTPTKKQFSLLLVLASQPSRVFTKAELMEAIWDYKASDSIALSVAISAYVSAADRRDEDALADLGAARGLLAQLDGFGAWLEVETAAALAAAAVELDDSTTASELLQVARSRLSDLPDAPMLDDWVSSIGEVAQGLSPSAAVELTPAELCVLRLLPSHLSNRQIAAELNVSQNTVKTQVRSAYRKLDVSSRHEAVQLCRELGLVAADDRSAGGTEIQSPDR